MHLMWLKNSKYFSSTHYVICFYEPRYVTNVLIYPLKNYVTQSASWHCQSIPDVMPVNFEGGKLMVNKGISNHFQVRLLGYLLYKN